MYAPRRHALAVLVALACGAPSLAIDRDGDGLEDDVEQMLLDRHRPVLVYESSERHWPHSAIDHVSRSQLIYTGAPEIGDVIVYTDAQLAQSPGLVLQGSELLRRAESSNVAFHPSQSHWALSQWDMRHAGVYPGADGSDHRGMYGHVAPTADGRILIQYWQLFPFNESECVSDCGDHEGDWAWLDLFVLNQAPDYPLITIIYHHHGDGNCAPTQLPWPEGNPWHPAPLRLPADGIPICYLEEQSHEWWPWASPGAECDFDPVFDFCPNGAHRGNGLRYRVPTVLNLGEKYYPMPGNVEVEIALMFNGSWGRWGSECFGHYFESPPGPVPRTDFYPATFELPRTRRYVDPESTERTDLEAIFGSPYAPYSSLARAVQGLPAGGSVGVRPGTYAEPMTISQPMTIEVWR